MILKPIGKKIAGMTAAEIVGVSDLDDAPDKVTTSTAFGDARRLDWQHEARARP